MATGDYRLFTLEDFVLDDAFCRWVKKPSAEDLAFWEDFLASFPGKAETISEARQIIEATHVAPESITGTEVRKEVLRFLDTVQFSAGNPRRSQQRYLPRFAFPAGIRLAAGCGIAVLLAVILWLRPDSPSAGKWYKAPAAPSHLVETVNYSERPMEIRLQDSSIVLLSPGSRLSYPPVFRQGANRLTYLTGEATFSVTRNTSPFIVISGNIITKVLGTKFTVKAFDSDKQSSVKVQSGKVSVYARNGANGVGRELKGLILTANQVAIFEKKDLNLSKTIVPDPEPVEAMESNWETVFTEMPFSAILAQFEAVYGIPIQYDKKHLSGCRITAGFLNETLFEQLDILCRLASASYEIVDGQIIVSGGGCSPNP